MSLFDDMLDDEMFNEAKFGPQQAIAGVLLCAMACDGEISDVESQRMYQYLSRKKMFRQMPADQINAMIDRLYEYLNEGGTEILLDRCYQEVPEDLHETVFANSVDILMASGSVSSSEKAFLEDLATKFKLDQQRAKIIIKVMSYKNRG